MNRHSRFAALSGTASKWLVLEEYEPETPMVRQVPNTPASRHIADTSMARHMESVESVVEEEVDAHDGWGPIRMRRQPLAHPGGKASPR